MSLHSGLSIKGQARRMEASIPQVRLLYSAGMYHRLEIPNPSDEFQVCLFRECVRVC